MGESTQAEDAKLVARCRQGDQVAFDALYSRHCSWVLNLCYRLTGNLDDAQDVTQNAFLRAYRALGRYDGRAAFSTWLYRVAVNVCMDELKRRGRQPVAISSLLGDDDPVPQISDPAPALDEALLARERRRALLAAIYSLPAKHRAVLVLFELQGLSYDEICQVLGASLGTVKSRLNRARLALRDRLEPVKELFLAGSGQSSEGPR